MWSEYQYHLKDHLGNVRTTFTTKDEVEESKATYETANAGVEQSKFLNHEQVRYLNHPFYDHTKAKGGPSPEGDFSQRLSGSAQEKIGLARSISVMPGDQVDIEVYAKYYKPVANDPSAFATLINNIINGLAVPAGTIMDGAGYALSANNVLPFNDELIKSGVDANAPKAYLNWAVFNRDYIQNLDKSGFAQITTNARENGSDVDHQLLEPLNEIMIDEPGFIYIWLSNENESPVEVYFDDFRVTHQKSPIVQQESFYPFGLNFDSYSRENSIENRYLYNQGTGEKTFKTERIYDLELNVDQSRDRTYDYITGRWWQLDPLADQGGQESWSPNHFSFNNPIRFNDPSGDCPTCDPPDAGDQLANIFTKPLTNLYTAFFGETTSSRTEAASEFAHSIPGFTSAEIMANSKLTGQELTTSDRVTIAVDQASLALAVYGLAGEGSVKPVTDNPAKAAPGKPIPENVVYRGLAEGEVPSRGLTARNPNVTNSPTSHVAGKKDSQWISTTKDKSVATGKYNSGNGVVQIDLNKVDSKTVDLSNGTGNRGMINNWAKKDKEVLIQGRVPSKAIKKID